MRYRSYSQADAEQLRDLIIADEQYDLTQLGRELGEGELADFSRIGEISDLAATRCQEGEDAEVVELSLSADVYMALRNVPVPIRDDPGFWRWLTARYMLSFLLVRDRSSHQLLGKEAIGAGSNSSDILGCRMFLRAQASRRESPDGSLEFTLLTDLGPKNHDFWQSHVVRVSTGAERELARALIKSHTADHIPTGKLRPFIRDQVNRPKTTVATFLMSDDEAAQFIEAQRNRFVGEEPSGHEHRS